MPHCWPALPARHSPPTTIEPPVDIPPPPVVGGWYIRGHIGMSNQYFDGLESSLYLGPSVVDYGWYDDGGFASAPIFGGGVGYKFNDYLRGDLTVEYRGKSDFNALDWISVADGVRHHDQRLPSQEVGTAVPRQRLCRSRHLLRHHALCRRRHRHVATTRSRNFRDINIINGGGGYADEDGEWNFAWALHTGLGIQATERMTIDLGYSFVVARRRVRPASLHNDDPASSSRRLNGTSSSTISTRTTSSSACATR